MSREDLVVLGTGNALVTECYNTCFALRGPEGIFLVDAGGGNGILKQLSRADIALTEIHEIFVTHQHTDHVLGLVWLIRMIAQAHHQGTYTGTCRIYCHDDLAEIIRTLVELLLEGKLAKALGDCILLVPVADGETRQICGRSVTFFDIHSTKARQFGFTLRLADGQKLTCLGDEPFNEANGALVSGSDWLLCEAFCLYGEADRFHPYEKHHSTVREACQIAQRFEIPNLVLWHTEETHLKERKALYTAEGRQFYSGRLYVPDDLDVILLESRS